jgi:hypothetical protein
MKEDTEALLLRSWSSVLQALNVLPSSEKIQMVKVLETLLAEIRQLEERSNPRA